MAMAAAVAGGITVSTRICTTQSPPHGVAGGVMALHFARNLPVSRVSVLRTGSLKFSPLPIRATSSEDTSTTSSVQTEEVLTNLKEKWDAVENKPTVLIYGGGALLALWISSIIVAAINSVPLLPKLMELIGLGYTGWFVYRYLLFKSSRKELATDVEELKKKITGSTSTIE
uniref:Cyanobacterial aminoacyl-tRNA synthetase CAAD domain-containing protein n=1 Tax=Picea sitchensis TaxID=3332 RepID=A9NP27_PICSI|nr:unknown [Picea sitchensis]ABK24109.1 unknown [Picea sitchensis]ACN40457.1 unknown [Picea sitchensis]